MRHPHGALKHSAGGVLPGLRRGLSDERGNLSHDDGVQRSDVQLWHLNQHNMPVAVHRGGEQLHDILQHVRDYPCVSRHVQPVLPGVRSRDWSA